MIKIKDVKFGIYSDSQLSGMKVLNINLEGDEVKAETLEDQVKNCEEVLDSLKEVLEKSDIAKDHWINFLLAQEYGLFTGDEIMSPENVDTTMKLFEMISHISHDLQNDIESVEFRKRPPMFVFKGTPKYATGVKEAYENFNILLIDSGDKGELPENMFALLEMTNHTFSNVICYAKDVDSVVSFYNNYILKDTIKIDINRAQVVLTSSENSDDIISKCVELGIRVTPSLKSISNNKDLI